MTSEWEHTKYGAADIYSKTARSADPDYKGSVIITEHFRESHDKRFDAILTLGCRIRHSIDESGGINTVNSLLYRGVTKKARSINRLFIKKVYLSCSQPESIHNAYTENQGWVGTVDHGVTHHPDLAEEGTLGFIWARLFYFKEADSANWIDQQMMQLAPLTYEWDWREITFPIVFYCQSLAWTTETKPNHTQFLIESGVRFFASDKSSRVARE